MRFGVVVFPGTWSDADTHYALSKVLRQSVEYVWHKDTDLSGFDCMILPGGFSYGDYLRCGSIARFSPVMRAIVDFAEQGGIVVGICNGFQILCEAGLLPGALTRNDTLQFRCEWATIRTETSQTPFTRRIANGRVLRVPISHGEGNYFADPETIRELEDGGRIVFRYSNSAGQTSPDSNPNGSIDNIAGIVNHAGNVLGMMPHPERCCEAIVGGTDGALVFGSIIDHLNPRSPSTDPR